MERVHVLDALCCMRAIVLQNDELGGVEIGYGAAVRGSDNSVDQDGGREIFNGTIKRPAGRPPDLALRRGGEGNRGTEEDYRDPHARTEHTPD